MRAMKWLLFVAVVALLVLMGLYWHDTQAWFFRYTGATDSGGTWYGFWSGFGGSIPDFLILGSIVTVYRHHNCHVKGCVRLGKPVDGTPYLACPVHHPAHEGSRRSVSLDTIRHAHFAQAARAATVAAPATTPTTGPTPPAS
jgi:hypothetical protein